jgi:hypothetical protein
MNRESIMRESQKCIQMLQRRDLREAERYALEIYAQSIRFDLWAWLKYGELLKEERICVESWGLSM